MLDHFGKPDVRGKTFEPWATDLKQLAALPNVVCKISGLTTEADWKNWQPDDLKFYFDMGAGMFWLRPVVVRRRLAGGNAGDEL